MCTLEVTTARACRQCGVRGLDVANESYPCQIGDNNAGEHQTLTEQRVENDGYCQVCVFGFVKASNIGKKKASEDEPRIADAKEDPENDNRAPSQIIDEILSNFGLRLSMPHGLLDFLLLQGIKDNTKTLLDFKNNIGFIPSTTIDYSKLVTNVDSTSWQLYRNTTILQLLNPPDTLTTRNDNTEQEVNDEEPVDLDQNTEQEVNDEEPVELDQNTIATGGINSAETDQNDTTTEGIASAETEGTNNSLDDENTVVALQNLVDTDSEDEEDEYDTEYDTCMREFISIMLIHYNYSTITNISFDISNIDKYLPYSTKLSSLQVVHLSRDNPVFDIKQEDIVPFIKQNQSIFPRKKPLRFEFSSELEYPMFADEDDFFDQAMSNELYITTLKLTRGLRRQYMRPKFLIYQAIHKPEDVSVCHIPEFYELAQEIDTSCLEKLCDRDYLRMEVGEGSSMENFLKRCDNLEALTVSVAHPEAFAWALETQESATQQYLKNLKSLIIESCQVYQSAVKAFNDSLVAFAQTLETVQLVHHCSYDSQDPNVVQNKWTLRSLQLQQLASATTIGDIPVLLPRLEKMLIYLNDVSNINVGSFDNCPNLKELDILFGHGDEDMLRPDGVAPTILPGPQVLLDTNWQQLTLDYTLFPIWDLPKLTRLTLQNMASMRFDFASLPLMQSLQSLRLIAGYCFTSEEIVDEYLIRQHKIPTAPTVPSSNTTDHQLFGLFGSYTFTKWTLPNLTNINMRGPPVALFCLEYLRNFPSLEALILYSDLPVTIGRTPILGSEYVNTLSSAEYEHIGDGYDNTPIYKSRLCNIDLTENIFMSGTDLTSLLTVYAPFLENLSVWLLQPQSCGYRFLEAINDADEENKVYDDVVLDGTEEWKEDDSSLESSNKKLPGRNLMVVASENTIKEREIKELGFIEIDTDMRLEYSNHRFRVYLLQERVFVRKQDFDRMQSELSIEKSEEAATDEKAKVI
ncbi:hypothetical protein BGZ76_009609 [Entomortierella beljakovae]|nr:hypothetical protein BGZ76_009609 [Entomortierella beljakovae]